jgi:hypothetical protein
MIHMELAAWRALSIKPNLFDSSQLAQFISQNKAYMADISIGQQKNKNDIQVGYAWNRIEQDAVLAAFVESDQRTQTSVLQNRIYGLWRLRSNTTAAYTYWFGRTLNTSLQNATRSAGVAPGQQDARLNRTQFDLIYTF